MKRKLGCGCLVLLVLLFFVAGPGVQFLVALGLKPVCIAGDWPNLRIVACPEPDVVSPSSSPLPLPLPEGYKPVPVIFDDDGSPDGVIALLYFLRHPYYDVRAVTISYGEAHPEIFARRMSQFLAGLGRAEIPVGYGRATPLAGDNAFPAPWRQVSDEFWGLQLLEGTDAVEPVPAARLIADTVSGSSQPVLVFISGSHTNLAEALRLDPRIREHIGGVQVMGGSIYAGGNIKSDWPAYDNTAAEWNIWADPVAAGEVFAAGLPLRLTPLDATNKVVFTQADAAAWAASGSPEGARARELLEWMLRSWSPKGAYIWDLVAAVSATDPAMCPAKPFGLAVIVAAGPEQGRTVVTGEQPNAAVCLQPDIKQIRDRVASVLGR